MMRGVVSTQPTVRVRVFRLAILLLLPGLSLAGMVTWRSFDAEHDAAKARLRDAVQAVARAVDGRLIQTELRLELLSEASSGAEATVSSAEGLRRLMEVAARPGARFVLWDEAGRAVMESPGSLAARTADRPSPGAMTANRPSGVTGSDVSTQWWRGRSDTVIRIARPAMLPDGRPGLLTADLPDTILQEQLSRLPLPANWIAAAYTDDLRHAARSLAIDRFHSEFASPAIRAALQAGGLRTGTGTSMEGIPVRFATTRSPRFGVPVAILAPVASIAQPSRASLVMLVVEGLFLVVIGLYGARGVARGITEPVEQLAAAARQVGAEGALPDLPRHPLEVGQVSAALADAHATLQERRTALANMNTTLAQRVAERTEELAAANRALAAQRERLGLILDHMPVGVLVNAPDGGLLYANPVAAALLGLNGGDGPKAVGLRRGGRPVVPGGGPMGLALAGQSGGPELLCLERTDGSRLDVEVASGPVMDDAGQVALSVTTLADVTQRVAAEEARRRSQRLEAVGQLTGGVAHEFNNLLMAVGGCLSLLAPRLEGPRERVLTESAIRAVERGGGLTRQLLAFARRQHLQPEPVDLAAMLRGILPLLETTVGRAVTVRLEAPPGLWPAMADVAQLELVLLNLAINARDAMPQGGELAIVLGNVVRPAGTRPEDPPAGEHVALTVRDTGTGMSADTAARVFEPFFTTKPVGQGSGLGLPQVLGVAQQLGGGVTIETTPGTGTTVTVFLPRSQSAPVAQPAQVAAPADAALAGLRVLLVDDDAEVREITREMLVQMGAAVRTAASGEAALKLMAPPAEAADLLVVDYTMPGMDGAALGAALRGCFPAISIVLMTGYSAAAVAAEVPPGTEVLQKPFRAAALAAAAGRAARARRAERGEAA